MSSYLQSRLHQFIWHFANTHFTSPLLFGNIGCCNIAVIFLYSPKCWCYLTGLHRLRTAAVSSELHVLCATQVFQKICTRRRCSMLQETSHPWNCSNLTSINEIEAMPYCILNPHMYPGYSGYPLSEFCGSCLLNRTWCDLTNIRMIWSILITTLFHGSVACGFLWPSAMDKQKSDFKGVEKTKTSQSSVHSNRGEENILGGKAWHAFCNASWSHNIDLLHYSITDVSVLQCPNVVSTLNFRSFYKLLAMHPMTNIMKYRDHTDNIQALLASPVRWWPTFSSFGLLQPARSRQKGCLLPVGVSTSIAGDSL